MSGIRLLVVLTLLTGCAPEEEPGPSDPPDGGTEIDCDPEVAPVLECASEHAVFQDGVELTSDSEIESFFGQYSSVAGSISLHGSEIKRAPNLGCLKSLDGELLLTETDLCRLDLPKLESAAVLSIHHNDVLESVTAPELVEVGASLDLESNPLLEDVDLSALREVGHWEVSGPPVSGQSDAELALKIQKNDSLTTLDLGSLEFSGGEISFNESDLLSEIALGQLERVNGGLRIDNMNGLTSLAAGNLVEIHGLFRFDHNGANHLMATQEPELPLRVDLPQLQTVGGEVYFDNNPSLVSMDLAALREVSGPFFYRGSIVLDGVDFGALERVSGDVHIAQIFGATFLDLDSLEDIEGGLLVRYSSELSRLSLPLLEEVPGDLEILQNQGLTELDFPVLERVDGDLAIEFNLELPEEEICSVFEQVEASLGGKLRADVECPVAPPESK